MMRPKHCKSPAGSAMLGVYISVPFCRAKCSYCNFASGVFGSERMTVYVEKLIADIREVPRRMARWDALLPTKANSLYFGGGTPSLLSLGQMGGILKALK
ncbi:MAG: hypothetical protein ACRD28_13050, partial [Acidobacteriaceae bacterium]